MEIYCADCGCLVERGVRVVPCETPECCCLDLPLADPVETTAARLRTAFNAHDLDTFRELLAEDAVWGEDPNGESYCHDRDHIIRTVKELLAEGIQARITETTTGPRGIAAHLQVEWPGPAQVPPNRVDFFQVYLVTDGLVTEIHGYDDRRSAVSALAS